MESLVKERGEEMSKCKLLILLCLFFLEFSPSELLARPKYASEVIPLHQSPQYFQNPDHIASAFWSLISYYIPQTKAGSCGSASLVMVLNAALSQRVRSSEDVVITEKMLWEQGNSCLWGSRWKQCPQKTEGSYAGEHGISLEQEGAIAQDAFQKHHIKAQIRVVHVSKGALFQEELLRALKKLSIRFFLISNFNQKFFTQDTDVGHFAPLAAYDPSTNRVLLLDPDRGSGDLLGYYEPYWVPMELFLDAMATKDRSEGQFRGYLTIEVFSSTIKKQD